MEKRHGEQGKRKAQIVSGSGGDIGGLVVWGGALAFAGLAAAFAFHKGRRRGANEMSSRRQKEDQTSQGQRCASNGSTKMVATPIDSSKFVCTESLILIYAEKTSSIHSVKEAENDDKEYGQELAPVERIEVWRKVEAFDDAPKASEDMTSIMHPVEKEEEEEEEHGDEEYAIEKGKENSEATESSSTGSNEEKIWPVELVEALCNGLAIPHSYSWQLASSSQANSCPMELIIVNQYRYVRQT
ncbi:hypothetical protein GH714_037691 [Hevea brasiliensis]|uniref:Uncharacterized protein n=1 Tax=Hevea brasiliensis TaxID=3981 RepID=A0A6A6LWR7_HEVBR|nr:hypothetical protein GH714_037691 [Hevea brasiliensis]